VVVFRFAAPLYFANAPRFRAVVDAVITGADPPVRVFVLDAAAIGDIDTTGADALREVLERLREAGAVTGIARCQPQTAVLLRAYGLLEVLGADRLFETDREAVAALTAATGLRGPA
jgi:SulP family sulfate permease